MNKLDWRASINSMIEKGHLHRVHVRDPGLVMMLSNSNNNFIFFRLSILTGHSFRDVNNLKKPPKDGLFIGKIRIVFNSFRDVKGENE